MLMLVLDFGKVRIRGKLRLVTIQQKANRFIDQHEYYYTKQHPPHWEKQP